METTNQILEDIKKHIDDMSHEEYFSPTCALLVKAYAHLKTTTDILTCENAVKKVCDGTN